jgi:hypothetical protein
VYQILSTYYQLSLQEKVAPLECWIADHPILVPKPDTDGKGYFSCISCTYRIIPGIDMIDSMYREIERVLNED